MPEDKTLIKAVLDAVGELSKMNVSELKHICMQYGINTTSDAKEELIDIILKEELTKEGYEAYQKYLRYHNYAIFREYFSGLTRIDELNLQLQNLYSIKTEASKQKKYAYDGKKKAQLATSDALPLVRLNIEYSHADSAFKDYISVMTKTGMKRARLLEEIEDLKRKNILYRSLRKKTIGLKEQEKEAFEIEASSEMEQAMKRYADAMKAYAAILKELFFKMLDNRKVSEAVMLYQGISMDFDSDEAYKVGYLYDAKIPQEEKERLFEDFINVSHFDPEVDLTGEVFYEAAVKYVCRYYELMESRNDLKIARCISMMGEVVGQQREVLDSMKHNQLQIDLFTLEDEKVLDLSPSEETRRKK